MSKVLEQNPTERKHSYRLMSEMSSDAMKEMNKDENKFAKTLAAMFGIMAMLSNLAAEVAEINERMSGDRA